MLWITNKNICTLIYIALQTSPNLNNSYIIFFLKTVHCISLRPSEKKSLIKNILQAYFSEERIVDFTIIMSNSTWLEAHSTCLSRNGSLWGEDNMDLFLYIRILAHQKTSWYVLWSFFCTYSYQNYCSSKLCLVLFIPYKFSMFLYNGLS